MNPRSKTRERIEKALIRDKLIELRRYRTARRHAANFRADALIQAQQISSDIQSGRISPTSVTSLDFLSESSKTAKKRKSKKRKRRRKSKRRR